MEINNICPVARGFKDDSNLRRTKKIDQWEE